MGRMEAGAGGGSLGCCRCCCSLHGRTRGVEPCCLLPPLAWRLAGGTAIPLPPLCPSLRLASRPWCRPGPVRFADVVGLNLYLHNIKWSNLGVLLAPQATIRDSHIELYRCAGGRAAGGRQPGAGGAASTGAHVAAACPPRQVFLFPAPSPLPRLPGAPLPWCRSIVQSRNAFTIEAAPNATLQNLYAR